MKTTASKPKPKPPRAKVPLYPYQERWVRDTSRFKIAVKAAQIGFSFAAALEAVLDCLEKRTLWIVLSRGERQSLEFLQKVRQHVQAMKIANSKLETSFFEQTTVVQREVRFPNGSRIIGLPANPDTARGYTGNMILDEFAFHQQDRAIWAAAFGRVSRGGLKLRVISTPNGQRGKFFDLAKEADLTDPQIAQMDADKGDRGGTGDSGSTGNIASSSPLPLVLPASAQSAKSADSLWSGHWCDVHQAVRQGCPIDPHVLRQAIGDEETWLQEYECVFLSDRENYIPISLIVECEHAEASTELPLAWDDAAGRECYFGYDAGRVRDLAVLAVVEKVGDVFWTRALVEMPAMKFSTQEQVLLDAAPFCLRGAMDATGMGMEMAERLSERLPGRVEPVTFTAARKQEMAVRMKRHFEERTLRIPPSRALRRDLNAVKRSVTSAGNIRFDAERTEQGHADRFWALALALHAAGDRTATAAVGEIESERAWYAPQERASLVRPDVPIRAATVRERTAEDSETGRRHIFGGFA